MKNKINQLGFVIKGIRHLSGKDFLKINPEEVILLDVRPEYELSRLFDIPNILYCPYEEIESQIKELPSDRYIIVADAVGLRSRETVEKLHTAGMKNIGNLAGGIVEWERDGLPITLDKTRVLSGSCMCQLRVRRKLKKDGIK